MRNTEEKIYYYDKLRIRFSLERVVNVDFVTHTYVSTNIIFEVLFEKYLFKFLFVSKKNEFRLIR